MKPSSSKSSRKKGLERLYARAAAAMKKAGPCKGAAPVFGDGPCPCPIMVVGEAPGRTETALGRPFVGRAGAFFSELLSEGLGAPREDVFITNAVKVWPHVKTGRLKTRPPTRAEAAYFLPMLLKEVELVAPKAIIAVGRTAFEALCPGVVFKPGGWARSGAFKAPVMPVYHPAYILRKQRALKENVRALKKALRAVKKAAS